MKIKGIISIVFLFLIVGCFAFLAFSVLNKAWNKFYVSTEIKTVDTNEKETAVPITKTESVAFISRIKDYIMKIENFSTKTLTGDGIGRKSLGVLATLKYYVNGTVNGANVISGKDNWLFYQSNTDGDSIADFDLNP